MSTYKIPGMPVRVGWGKVGEPQPDWRDDLSVDRDPDDEELSSTPADVVAVLGFDPLEGATSPSNPETGATPVPPRGNGATTLPDGSLRVLGGAGSGDFNHSGREGLVGGSGGGGVDGQDTASPYVKESRALLQKDVDSRLTKKQKDAVDDYVGLSYDINDALHTHHGMLGYIREKSIRDSVRALDDVFDSVPVSKEDITLYRGVAKGHAPIEGESVSYSYLSTSPYRKTAEDFAEEEGGSVLEIHVPKGTKLLPTSGEGGEIVLPRDLRIKRTGDRVDVLGIKTNAAKHNTAIHRNPRRLLASPAVSLIEQRFIAEITRRMRAVKSAIRQKVVEEDCFGLLPPTLHIHARDFAFTTSSDKVDGFMNWLQDMNDKKVLDLYVTSDRRRNVGRKAWERVYIQSAYKKGMVLGEKELKKKGLSPSQYGTQTAFPVDYLFASPIHADRVGLIYTRTFSELKGVTNAMDQGISRVLAQGLAEGKNPNAIARTMTDQVDRIGLYRARLIARTEVMRAHHVATINTYRQAGVEGVEVQAEWSSAGDDDVCDECKELEGKIFTLEEIEPLIPLHPQCRCVSLPVLNSVDMKRDEEPDREEEVQQEEAPVADEESKHFDDQYNADGTIEPDVEQWEEDRDTE